MLVIQHIQTVWTKNSRGMPEATRRNSVPAVMSLPVRGGERADMLVHRVLATESRDFELAPTLETFSTHDKYWSFLCKDKDNALDVYFKYHYQTHGQPQRKDSDKPIFTLAPGELAVFRINGRFTSHNGQHYAQHVVNFAWVDAVSVDLFVKNAPVHVVDELAQL